MQEAVRNDIILHDGVFEGPLRSSRNTAQGEKGSIHDDATASKLGFRGGTVAGSIHLDLFPPLALKAFGKRWFERGSVSMYFINATTDGEPVLAFVEQPPAGATDVQVKAWIERDDHMKVAEGTIAAGNPGVPTALQARPLDRFTAGELRILANVKPGDALTPVTVGATLLEHKGWMNSITEPLDWYTGPSPWGGPILSPAFMVRVLYNKPVGTLRERIGTGVGLFGAIELRNVNGPVFVDREYTATGKVLAVGQSPKTEYMWYETGIDDEDGKRIAEMRMLLRWMKASSPLYAE